MNTSLILAKTFVETVGPLFPLVIMVIMFWVIAIRPQQKRAKALRERQASLKKGDNVVTIGGMHATVNAVSDTTVSLRISEGIYVKYDKSAIAAVLTKGAEKDEKAAAE